MQTRLKLGTFKLYFLLPLLSVVNVGMLPEVFIYSFELFN